MAFTGPALHPWHAAVDWSDIAGAGHRLIWCPATEGMATVQSQFHDRWAAAAAAGFVRGAVHRLTPFYLGRGEARHFVSTLGDPKGSLTAVAVQPDGPRLDDRLPHLDQVAEFADEFRHLTGGHPLIVRTSRRWWAPGDPTGRGQQISPYLWHHDGAWAWRHHAGDPNAMGRWGNYGGWTFPTIWSMPRIQCAGVNGLCTLAIFPGEDVVLAQLLDVDALPGASAPRRLLERLRGWLGQTATTLS